MRSTDAVSSVVWPALRAAAVMLGVSLSGCCPTQQDCKSSQPPASLEVACAANVQGVAHVYMCCSGSGGPVDDAAIWVDGHEVAPVPTPECGTRPVHYVEVEATGFLQVVMLSQSSPQDWSCTGTLFE